MSKVIGIGTAVPEFRINQSEFAPFMSGAMQLEVQDERKLKVLFRSSGISSRYSVLPEYSSGNPQAIPTLLGTTADRMDLYKKHALRLSLAAMENLVKKHPVNLSAITHLITVSCTGMYAPGLDIDLLHSLGLPGTVQRTAINFMGCYAAITALKVADAFARIPGSVVLVVCTELCSLHFQNHTSDDSLLANTLFGDGAAACVVSNNPTYEGLMAIEGFYNDLEPAGNTHMTWGIGNHGFEMNLSSYVPEILEPRIRMMYERMMHHWSKEGEPIRFGVHPGGIRILTSVERSLEISSADLSESYSVLRDFGNMSSPTILFVLDKMLTTTNQKLVAMAFGPGISLESIILKPA